MALTGSRLRVLLLLLTVLTAGIAGGVALERLWLSQEEGEREEERKETVIERFSDELGLTGAQQATIDTILGQYRERMKELWSEVHPRYRALVDSVRHEIEGVLDSSQVRRYRQLLEETRDRRRDRDDDGAGKEGEKKR